jgi:acyl-ACP thioesterase
MLFYEFKSKEIILFSHLNPAPYFSTVKEILSHFYKLLTCKTILTCHKMSQFFCYTRLSLVA